MFAGALDTLLAGGEVDGTLAELSTQAVFGGVLVPPPALDVTAALG